MEATAKILNIEDHFKLIRQQQEDDLLKNREEYKQTARSHKSNKTECLYSSDEIIAVYNEFKKKIQLAETYTEQYESRRNLTMFVCQINLGLRGGDFCSLQWSDLFDKNWRLLKNPEYIPEKTIRKTKSGKIKVKRIELSWSKDLETVLFDFLEWQITMNKRPDIDDYIFKSRKSNHISRKRWGEIVQETKNKAGIQQRISTHGLRKTMAHQYIENAEDKSEALLEVSSMFGHASPQTTMIYACVNKENINYKKQSLSFIE